MRNINKIISIFLMVMGIMVSGCKEGGRFEISGDDSTPPGVPVFVESEPLPGGARIFFRPPADHDVLYIEASYLNAAGKTQRFAASFAAGLVDVYGFHREGEHPVELCAVDRSGNRSTSIRCTVEALEPPAVTLAKSLDVLSSFSAMLLKWENESEQPLYVWVDFTYTQKGVRREHTTVFNTNQTEIRTIDSLKLFAGEQVSVKINVRDKYDNVIQAKDTAIVLLVDELLPKDGWTLPDAGSIKGGVTQVSGLRMEEVIDDVIDIDVINYFSTLQTAPWSLIIDLGEEYELSRIVTHQQWSGYNNGATSSVVDVRGNLYRGNNVLTYNLYGWDETSQSWDHLTRCVISPPLVISDGDYTLLGKAGDMFFIFPEEPQFSKPTRFIRYEALSLTGKSISEITLYGRKAQ